jgi:hypothetical protein
MKEMVRENLIRRDFAPLEGKPAEALIFYGVSKNQFLFY